MGWFSTRAAAAPVGPEPIIADSEELARARQLLHDYERSQMAGGTDAQARGAVLAIARAGSLPGAVGGERPWRWLAAIIASAAQRGDADLVARIGLFTSFWINIVAPHMTLLDESDMRLAPTIPDECRSAIISTALIVLGAADPRRVVVDDQVDPTNSMTVGDVLAGCALTARTTRISPEAAAVAARVLPTPQR